MVVEKNYRLDGLTKRKTLFTVQIRKAGGSRIGKEVSRSSALAKKLDLVLKLPYQQRKNAQVWVDSGEIVDIRIPEPR